MDRNEFEKLTALQQIEHFNKLLSENISNNKICDTIGIPRTTLRDRFKKAGYKFDTKEKCYKSVTNETPTNDVSNTKVTPSKNIPNPNPILPQENKDQYKNETIIPIENLNQIMDIVNFKNDLVELINLKQDIKETIDAVKKYEFEKNIIDIPDLKIDFSKMNGEIRSRSFKVYDDVIEKFLNFAKKNNSFKQQDLLAQAMIEFIERYDR